MEGLKVYTHYRTFFSEVWKNSPPSGGDIWGVNSSIIRDKLNSRGLVSFSTNQVMPKTIMKS